MLSFTKALPLSLYIHLPWCIKKCPYCDFNSHKTLRTIPENMYIKQLLADLHHDLIWVQKREIKSIFIGGGTPNLFSPQAIATLLQGIDDTLSLSADIEITMEANPSSISKQNLVDFKKAGINRLSLGIQSFDNKKLLALGRLHNGTDAKHAIDCAHLAQFSNINLDLMHTLPKQTTAQALEDLITAIDFSPQHISWYELTIEPHTVFAKHTPDLPDEEVAFAIWQQGQQLLTSRGYHHYEISAYSKANYNCWHNVNYWQFGDYLGIGAGAHSKITDAQLGCIMRYVKIKNPRYYLAAGVTNHLPLSPFSSAAIHSSTSKRSFHSDHQINDHYSPFIMQQYKITPSQLPLEFMINALRLNTTIAKSLFVKRTGLPLDTIAKPLQLAQKQGLLHLSDSYFKTTRLGQRFLNECLALFSSKD